MPIFIVKPGQEISFLTRKEAGWEGRFSNWQIAALLTAPELEVWRNAVNYHYGTLTNLTKRAQHRGTLQKAYKSLMHVVGIIVPDVYMPTLLPD